MSGDCTMPINDWPAHERPRERLLAHGAAALSDAELLAEARNSLGSFSVMTIENEPQKACEASESVPTSEPLDG